MGIERKAMESLEAVASSSVEKILAVGPVRSREVLTQVLKEITEEFSKVSRDAAGSKRLYEAVSQTSAIPIAQRLLKEKDHLAVLNKASVQLKSIVRDVSYQRMHRKFAKDLNLTAPQADNSLALASLSVLEALKAELKSSEVENNSAGIATLLKQGSEKVSLAESGISSSSVVEKKSTLQEPPHPSGSYAMADHSSASLLRFAPHALLAILALGAVKYCSDAGKHRVVEEERVSLQQELTAARADAEANTLSIKSLQSELESGQSQINSLKSDLDLTHTELQASTAELVAERNVPKDTAELQMLLLNATKERDAAVDTKQALSRRFETVSGKYDDVSVEVESVKAELEAARAIISSNKGSAAQVRQLKENVSEINQQYDAAIQRNASIAEENKALRAMIDDSAPTITDLEAQVVDLQTSNSALEQEKKLRQEEISQLVSNIDGLEQRHQSAGPKINKLETQITSLHHEVATLEATLQLKNAALEEEQAARKASSTRLTAKNTDVQNQLSQMLLLKKAAESKFGQERSKVSQQSETLSDLREKIDVLEISNEESKSTSVALQKEIDELEVKLLDAEERISASDSKLTERDVVVAAVSDELESARDEIAELKSADGTSSVLRDELRSDVLELTAEKNDVLESNKDLNDQVVTLTGELKVAKQSSQEAELRITALEKSLDAERNSLQQISNERDQYKDAIVIANTDIDGLTSEKADALNKIDELNRQVSELSGVVDASRTTISDLEKGIREIENEKISLQQGEGDFKGKIVSLDARLNMLGNELNQERENTELLAVENSELEKQIAGVTRERDEALKDVEQLQRSLSTADQKIVELTDNQLAIIAETKSANATANRSISETLALRNSIEQQLVQASLGTVKVQSIENDRAVAITLGSKSLYRTGDASLTREGGRTLNKIGKILEKHPDWRIDIEGHTDSLPIGVKLRQRYPSNWELSSARASAVVTFLRLTTNINTESLSARGYAETQPIADNGSVVGREQNRRVDIILRK